MNTQQIIQFVYKFKTSFKLSISKFNEVGVKIRNYEMPERIKGTFLERWAKYWHNLYIDYKNVAIDIAKDCRQRPIRATIYTSALGGCFYLNYHNPDEITFRDQLIVNNLKLILVGEPIRNPISTKHVEWLEQCYNEKIIRRLNLGILSLIWLDNYDKDCSLYKTICPYLKPQYVTFYERIVDIGFLDRWWILERKMKNYDINEAEFSNIKTKDFSNVSVA